MSYISLHEFLSQQKEIVAEEKHSKDFDTWNSMKKNLEISDPHIECNEREIWWCSLGLNIGHEQDGKNENFERPVLIVKILSKDTCLCVPLTTSDQKHRLRIPLKSFSETSSAIISQVKTISIKRLSRGISLVSREDLSLVKKSLRKLLK